MTDAIVSGTEEWRKEICKMRESGMTAADLEKDETLVVRLLDMLLADGYRENASDIHMEPREKHVMIRLRIDGHLTEHMVLEKAFHLPLIARTKVLSGLDIAERRLPQDGHIKTTMNGIEMDLRTSTVPTVWGEKVVLRFLNRSMRVDREDTFGMSEDNYRKVLNILRRPNGIFYITGPTGSGKTTTLYMILEHMKRDPVNIITIEDPVERVIEGISQVQVNQQAGLTFETGLRAALRQDPDIIMIGETRDSITARTSVRAAITGHIVLSTLHTRDAVRTVERMMDMGVEPYLAADSLNGVLSQRLVRKVCSACAEEMEPDEEERKILGPKIRRIRRGKGCKACNYTGYKGRMAVHEILVVDEEIRKMMAERRPPEEIHTYAVSAQRLVPLKTDIMKLVDQGITTVQELVRLIPD